MNDYTDISNIEYYGIDNIYNPYSICYSENNDECDISYDDRYIVSGVDNIYEEEYYEYIKDFFSYMEYNEVYDY